MKKMSPISLAVVGLVLLSGCAATQKTEKVQTNTDRLADYQLQGSMNKTTAVGALNNQVSRTANFGRVDKNWVNPVALQKTPERVNLPPIFAQKVALTMPGQVEAIEVVTELQRASNIQFEIAPDIYNTSGSAGKIIGPSGGAAAGSGGSTKGIIIADYVFRGTLEDGLNLLAAKTNLAWKWNGRTVELYKYETKTYNISALAGATTSSSTVDLKGDTSGGGSGASGAPSGSNSSSVGRTSKLTTWDEVKSYLLAQMSPDGSMAILEATGAVTIKDVPSVHKRLEKSINEINALMSKQIHLNVDVYSVSVNEGDNYGVNWTALYQKTASSAISLTGAVGTSVPNQANLAVNLFTGPLAGTNAILSALSTLGKASLVNQFAISTLNGQPTPIASNRNFGYVKSTKVTPATAQGAEPSTEFVPGEISSGINMNVTPKVEPNGNVLLEYSLNLSEVEGFKSIGTKDADGNLKSGIELPTSTLKSVLQRASLKSGQTLVLSGFKQTSSKVTKQGVGDPRNILAGGSNQSTLESQYLVITVTPYVASGNTNNKR